MSNIDRQFYKKNTLLVRSLTVDEKLVDNLEDILFNCTELTELKILSSIGNKNIESAWLIWDGNRSTNEFESFTSFEEDSDDDDGGQMEVDPKVIATNSRKLKHLSIGPNVQLKRQPNAPPTLDQLRCLERLDLHCGSGCDRSRDEWNLRVLCQSSQNLTHLDLRGCYLKIFSLGWLITENLQVLHLYYQVPAASVFSKWTKSLKYLTLAKISKQYKRYRSMGPEKPGEELDACLMELATTTECPLVQLDLQCSDCSLDSIKLLIDNCKNLNYLDTSDCSNLPPNFRVRCTQRENITRRFLETK